MKKIGICGNFNLRSKDSCGQTIKTRMIYEELIKIFGENEVLYVDTNMWKKQPFKLLLYCIKLSLQCKNLIILPAQNGINILIPLFLALTKILKRKLHYIVIGGWLSDVLSKKHSLLVTCKSITYIYVETKTLANNLKKLGFDHNIIILPNFKSTTPSIINEHDFSHNIPYKFCTFSRVNYLKGIENAIYVISKINKHYGKEMIKLDIYGPIENGYEEHFNNIIQEYSSFTCYKGDVNHSKSNQLLKEYFMMLFPTKYFTEGIPGTIIDAFLAGIPVLASRWESCYDIIEENITGITYEFDNDSDLYKKLEYVLNNKIKILEMKNKCLDESKKYIAANTINHLIENLS